MKNHFFFSYVGNKREEVEHIYNKLDLNNIDTIVEPFCGSCAVSYYIWKQNKDKNYKYILNDLDNNLIDLIRLIKDGNYKDVEDDVNKKREEILTYGDEMDKAKKIYLEYVKNGKVNGYLLGHKYFKLNINCFPMNELNRLNKKLDLSSYPVYEFITTADIELYNEDANKIIDKYDNDKSFIFLDPPYIASCNSFYSTDTDENLSNIYEMLYYKKLSNFKCKIMICHENNWLFKILFKDYINNDDEYSKQYKCNLHKGFLKREKTTHICVKNY
jgi:site-specific DNA-adenine methylase